MKAKVFLSIMFMVLIGCNNRDVVSPELYIPSRVDPLKVTSPSEGQNWKPGSIHKIVWSSPTTIKQVDIFLYRKQELKATIILGLENKGEYVWEVPTDLNNSVHYRIKVVDHITKTEWVDSDYFYIRNE